MADLSGNVALQFPFPKINLTRKVICDSSTAQAIFAGTPMMLDANVDTVYAQQFDSAVTPTTGDAFIGIALGKLAITLGDTEGEDTEVEVMIRGIVGYPNDFSFTDANVDDPVYFSDEGTLTTTAGTNLGPVGKITHVDNSYVFIELNPIVQA